MNNDRKINARFIDVIDGIRSISIIIVLIFHFWQQTWIWPVVSTPWLSFFGITEITFSSYAKVGYLFVDMMVLLSGFLLFLPIARQVLLGKAMSSWKQYARNRVARILPSYLFCIIVLFIYNISTGVYESTSFALADLISHLTFTQTLNASTYFNTNLNVVLWTVAIEVWFYCIFPFVASYIKRKGDGKDAVVFSIKKVILVAVVMYLIFAVYIYIAVLREGAFVPMGINQLPAFLGVYANGMLGAFILVGLSAQHKRSAALSYFSLTIAVMCIFIIDRLVKDCAALQQGYDTQIWQVNNRFELTGTFTLLIISLALSPKWVRWIFSNSLMRFLSTISYNLYIWHQWIAVQFKEPWRFPAWTGTIPPNQLNDMEWMQQYAVVITIAAFAVAVLATYLIERPFSNLILGKPVFGSKKTISDNGMS